jgi:hypothetical protein
MLPYLSSLVASFLLVVSVKPGSAEDKTPGQMEQVAAHLQLLGFECEDRGEVMGVRHPELPSFVVREYRDGLLFTAFFQGKEAATTDRAGFLVLVNKMNQASVLVRCFVADDGDLGLEAWLPSQYERQIFARFLEAWHNDLSAILTLEPDTASRYLN